jgi:hypothetical protein
MNVSLFSCETRAMTFNRSSKAFTEQSIPTFTL